MTTLSPPQLFTAGRPWRQWIGRLVLLAGLWWLITGGSASAWLIGLPAVALAAWANLRLGELSKRQISLTGSLRFIPFFLWESLHGGVDVAIRTLTPRMPIQPGFVAYQTTLDHASARIFFANCVSLLPGTLAADLKDDRLEIHVLNLASEPQTELNRLERAVARLFLEGRTS
jgi:multicomponent Na+:H+ antiporter subunit E